MQRLLHLRYPFRRCHHLHPSQRTRQGRIPQSRLEVRSRKPGDETCSKLQRLSLAGGPRTRSALASFDSSTVRFWQVSNCLSREEWRFSTQDRIEQDLVMLRKPFWISGFRGGRTRRAPTIAVLALRIRLWECKSGGNGAFSIGGAVVQATRSSRTARCQRSGSCPILDSSI